MPANGRRDLIRRVKVKTGVMSEQWIYLQVSFCHKTPDRTCSFDDEQVKFGTSKAGDVNSKQTLVPDARSPERTD